MKIRMIVLTDCRTHRQQESIYPLLRKMVANPVCKSIRVASRRHPKNQAFFDDNSSTSIAVVDVDQSFDFQGEGGPLETTEIVCTLTDCDVVFLRIDRPVSDRFLKFISKHVCEDRIFNRPTGIMRTGSKEFLLQFSELCPPIKLCTSIDHVEEMLSHFSVVLKPLHSFGGKGLIKLTKNGGWNENTALAVDDVLRDLKLRFANGGKYLGMKFLENVNQGDKRIIVVNGQVMGATLRLPKDGSWLCNLSSGGSAHYAEPDEDELRIAAQISPVIQREGVVIFGFDTLVDDDGHRVLSEINTLNVGGLLEAEQYSGRPIVQQSADLIWSYICDNF